MEVQSPQVVNVDGVPNSFYLGKEPWPVHPCSRPAFSTFLPMRDGPSVSESRFSAHVGVSDDIERPACCRFGLNPTNFLILSFLYNIVVGLDELSEWRTCSTLEAGKDGNPFFEQFGTIRY